MRTLAECHDYHTGGEPFRIVAEPPVPMPGESVADRRARITPGDPADTLRRALVSEPRGHADMYGGFVVAPDDAGAHFGVLFWHKDGFSTACGHGTIALGIWAVDTGLVAAPRDGSVDVVIDVPSGRVVSRVAMRGGEPVGAEFRNVASYLIDGAVPVATARGELTVAMAFGGAIYAHLDAASVGLTVEPANYSDLIAIGREIKWALNESPQAQHPDPRLSGVYGTIIYEDCAMPEAGARAGATLAQRNVTVFADGQVDRSPCGSGSSSRFAALVAQGRLGVDETLSHTSIVGSHFTVGGRPGERSGEVLPSVFGTAHPVARATFVHRDDDDLYPGFVLR